MISLRKQDFHHVSYHAPGAGKIAPHGGIEIMVEIKADLSPLHYREMQRT